MVTDADEPTLDALTRFGTHLGLGYQIVDDCLDLTGTDAELGKPAGQDLVEGIYTLPVIYALAEDPGLRPELGTPIDGERLAEVRRRASANGAVDAALAVARDHATKAGEALAGADTLDASVCDALRRLVEGLVARQS
jgi:heptaprenyl diphosphate synthase